MLCRRYVHVQRVLGFRTVGYRDGSRPCALVVGGVWLVNPGF